MATIVDYLYWRGDLSFNDSAFNEIDAMILSQIAYFPWNQSVRKRFTSTMIPLSQAIPEIIWEGESIVYKEFLMEIAPTIAQSNRFGSIQAIRFVDEVNDQSQFCAITFLLPDGNIFVAFRGTDNSISGWKENMDLAYEEIVPAQQKAVNYLFSVGNHFDNNILIGGHSKGGNLAVYSAAKCVDYLGDRIIGVYNFDGPGFNEKVINKIKFNRIADRVHTYVPQDSLIGMLLDHKEPYTVIHSNQHGGANQHYMISWEIGPTSIEKLDSLSKFGSISSDSISSWIRGMSDEEKKEFVGILFGLLEQEGITTVDELLERKNIMTLIGEYSKLGKNEKQTVSGTINALGSSFLDRLFDPIAVIAQDAKGKMSERAQDAKDKMAVSAYKAVEKVGGRASELASEYRNHLDSGDNC